MNRANWKDGAELIGIGAIVLSLIFVGFQIKQSHEIAMAAQYQARLDTWVGVLAAYIQSDVALRVVGERTRSSPLPDGIDQVKWKKWLDDTPVEEIGYQCVVLDNPIKNRGQHLFSVSVRVSVRRGLARIPSSLGPGFEW